MYGPAETKQNRKSHECAGWRDAIYTGRLSAGGRPGLSLSEVRGAVDLVDRP